MASEVFEDKANEILQRLLDFYAPHFAVTPGYELDGTQLSALTEYHNRAERTLLGIKLNSLGNESNEYGLYLLQEIFDLDAFHTCEKLLLSVEQNLVKVHKEHAMSLLSLIVLASGVTQEAATALKKYKLHVEYKQSGWCSARFVVYDVNSGEFYFNNEGKILKNLLQRALSGQKL